MAKRTPGYRHGGAGLIRAAVLAVDEVPAWWPDLADVGSCRVWLAEVWRPGFADAVAQASPVLALWVGQVLADEGVGGKVVRRVTATVVRYVVRSVGRPTPFGLFAGVAPVTVAGAAAVSWAVGHRPVARVDTVWLSEVIDGLEADPVVLDRVMVVFSGLAARRGGRWETWSGADQVSVRAGAGVDAVREAARTPIRFAALVEVLAARFGVTDAGPVRRMVVELIGHGFLRTGLRAPMTDTDPLGHAIATLSSLDVDALRPVVADLVDIWEQLRCHNRPTSGEDAGVMRGRVVAVMAGIGAGGRTPLAVDLLLDARVQVPGRVVADLEAAAGVLVRLQRPLVDTGWPGFHTAFVDRYGTGTLVPVTEVVNPDTGLGFPAGFPGSVFPAPADGVFPRDRQLLALAWDALATGAREVVLSDARVAALTGDWFNEARVPAHVEIAARLHAPSCEAVTAGNYLAVVGLARAAGTLTSRFTTCGVGGRLEDAYRAVPTGIADALPVQLVFRPMFAHAENICRVPTYLPHVLALDDLPPAGVEAIEVADVAVTATGERLFLVSMSRQQVIVPQVFHALAVEKQTPPLVRFLAHLDRGFTPVCREFDWGPHTTQLPYLPRVRYGRTVLAAARWRLNSGDLPDPTDRDRWAAAVSQWRHRWGCPDTIELRDDDRGLRLSLTIPAHLDLLRTHLSKVGYAVLVETASVTDLGWLGGHTHDIAITLATTATPRPALRAAAMPVLTNTTHGQLPATPAAGWLYVKVFTHPRRLDEIIATHLPDLITHLDDAPAWWFIRYRDHHDTDHLRLRIHTTGPEHYIRCLQGVGTWANGLQADGVVGRLTVDTYYPEVGRYGPGPAMAAAEAVFATDSRLAAALLRCLPGSGLDPVLVTVTSMIDIVEQFLGGRDAAMTWLATQPPPPAGDHVDHTTADVITRTAAATTFPDLYAWPPDVLAAWQDRAATLAAYAQLHADAGGDTDMVVGALLHLDHNRLLGIDPAGETRCLRLARRTAISDRSRAERPRHAEG